MKPVVRDHLLFFAHVWIKFTDIVQPQDVIDIRMPGGNANFNYTPLSDIDVHVVVDKTKLANIIPQPWLDEFLQDKKKLWQLTHHDSVYGFSLEPYIQDVSEPVPTGQGVFSLKNNRWIMRPSFDFYRHENDAQAERKADEYERLVNDLIDHHATVDSLKEIKNKINQMRGAGLTDKGEFSPENLAFKELRNRGVIDRIHNYDRDEEDHTISL